jgi:hypothetical protein
VIDELDVPRLSTVSQILTAERSTYSIDKSRVWLSLGEEMRVITKECSWETGVEGGSLVQFGQLFSGQGDLE